MRRSLAWATSASARASAHAAHPPPPPPAAPAPAAAAAAAAAAAPRAASAAGRSEDETDGADDGAADGADVVVRAPTVGVLRRGKYVKGKLIGKGELCRKGDVVKAGQTICYVDKLGTFEPVLAPQAGEIADFVRTEGDPVSWGDVVVSISPFFGGHIIGDSKYK